MANNLQTNTSDHLKHSLTYRPDIDGLRAFAVLAVVFYHFQIPYVSGGYIGVDVFFVISGYLITSIIAKQLKAGTFSFADFYERRARRIFPAFFGMILFFFFVPFFMPTFTYFRDFYVSVIMACTFIANLLFWKSGGYFDAPVTSMPMLHTWSLGIEEQFYIFIPFLLYLLWRFARTRTYTIFIIMASSSFLLSAVMIFYKPNSVFYLLPTRAWELFLGSLLALTPPPPHEIHITHQNKTTYRLIETLMTFLLIAPIFFYDKNTLFPAFAALPPCLGATLYIYLGQFEKKTWLHILLSTKSAVFIGLLSYSIYLWHWPIWVFTNLYWRLTSYPKATPILAFTPSYPFMEKYTLLFCFTSTFVCAYFSWKYIEMPIRTKKILSSRIFFLTTFGILLSFFVTASFLLLYSKTRTAIFQYFDQAYRVGELDVSKNRLIKPYTFPFNSKERKDIFIAIGDSHLGHYMDILESFKKHNAINAHAFSSPVPLIGDFLPIQTGTSTENHRLLTSQLYNHITDNAISHVLISIRWITRLTWQKETHDVDSVTKAQKEQFEKEYKLIYGEEYYQINFHKKIELVLKDSLTHFTEKGIHVWLVMPNPEMPFHVPASLQNIYNTGGDVSKVGISWEDYIDRTGFLRNILKKYESPLVHIIDPALILCEDGFCRAGAHGKSLYWDDDHLSLFGAEYVKNAFLPFFEAVKASAGANAGVQK